MHPFVREWAGAISPSWFAIVEAKERAFSVLVPGKPLTAGAPPKPSELLKLSIDSLIGPHRPAETWQGASANRTHFEIFRSCRPNFSRSSGRPCLCAIIPPSPNSIPRPHDRTSPSLFRPPNHARPLVSPPRDPPSIRQFRHHITQNVFRSCIEEVGHDHGPPHGPLRVHQHQGH